MGISFGLPEISCACWVMKIGTRSNKAINKAIGTCTTLNIPVADNFIQCERALEGTSHCADFKLSRFACCLTALNGDAKKAHAWLPRKHTSCLSPRCCRQHTS